VRVRRVVHCAGFVRGNEDIKKVGAWGVIL
jgi:hypothetical protein